MTGTSSLVIAWIFYGFMSFFPIIYLSLKKDEGDDGGKKND